MLRVGLTGGIGAGKSTVASTFAELGAMVIDADRIAREVVEPGTEGLAEVVAEFGAEVLDADGALDRPALAEVVFGDDDRRARLNAILHPRIGARTGELLAQAPDDAVVVHDVPLLVENGMGAAFGLVVVVDAPVDVRVARLGETRDMSEEDARARIASQAGTESRRAAADVWIENAGPAGETVEVVTRLWHDRIAPFEANLRAGRVVPVPDDVVEHDPEWPVQARRLAARAALAAPTRIDRVEHVGPTAVPGLPAPDVIDLLVLVADGAGADPDAGDEEVPAALARIGFPGLEAGRHGGADPGRPVRLHVRRASDPAATGLLELRDVARADPDRTASDPDGVRAEVTPDR